MQSEDLKIGALYLINGLADGTYRGLGPLYPNGPLCHRFTFDNSSEALGLHDTPDVWQAVEPAPVTDLHAFAAGVAAHNHERRVAALRDVYTSRTPRRLGPSLPLEEWLPRKLHEWRRTDFLLDNFPQGFSFKLCGCECMSAGVEYAHAVEGGSVVKYVTAGPHGLQTLRLPFAMAAAVVLGAPL